MDFEIDPLIEQLSRQEKKKTFGMIICALFHQPKPISFAELYSRLTNQFNLCLTDDEKHAVYIYPIAHLHITIAVLHSFKHAWPQSPEQCLMDGKKSFEKLKEIFQQKSIVLVLDKIELSPAAGYFQFQDVTNGIESLRQSIGQAYLSQSEQSKIQMPNIVHSTFLRFARKVDNPILFEEKFHRICNEILVSTPRIRIDIDEICLAFEAHPYMHIECNESHVLDTFHVNGARVDR
jgi:hypothetical protein